MKRLLQLLGGVAVGVAVAVWLSARSEIGERASGESSPSPTGGGGDG